jgi:hypothetical protein
MFHARKELWIPGGPAPVSGLKQNNRLWKAGHLERKREEILIPEAESEHQRTAASLSGQVEVPDGLRHLAVLPGDRD